MAAPKGNKYALGLTDTGREPIYKYEDDLKSKVIEYFESLEQEESTEGDEPKQEQRPTVTGLALYLGFASRQSMYDYVKKEEFSYIIKRAQMVIEMSYEEMLLSKASTGSIFALKNMGWKDKTEVANTIMEQPLFPE